MNPLWNSGRRFAFAVGLLGGLAMLVSTNRAAAQMPQGKHITDASNRLTALVDQANKEGYALTDNTLSIGGGWLKQNKKNWVLLYTVNLTEGQKYRFLAAGDDDAKDVDIQVKNDQGKVVAEDKKTDPEAVVDLTAPKTGTYTVHLRLYDSKKNDPCVCLAVIMTKTKKK